MSKRAEERAMEIYPIQMEYCPERDLNEDARAFFQEGYGLAEKDLGWHSVEESLPPIDEEVIVLTQVPAFGRISFAHLVNSDVMITIDGKPYKPEAYSGWNIPGVKYWMPMPKIPNEDE